MRGVKEGSFKYDPGVLRYTGTSIDRFLSGEWRSHLEMLRAQLETLKEKLPPAYPYVHVIQDIDKPANEHVHIRGNKDNLGEEVPRRFLAILSNGERVPFTKGSGRLELAEAIASPQNPVTARVIVNRIWQQHFGEGLVRTPSNFGQLGERPSHPELLDYLASYLIEKRWSLKALHREIMLSSTYKLSTDFAEKNFAVDPGNRLLVESQPASFGRGSAPGLHSFRRRHSGSFAGRRPSQADGQQKSEAYGLWICQPEETGRDSGVV